MSRPREFRRAPSRVSKRRFRAQDAGDTPASWAAHIIFTSLRLSPKGQATELGRLVWILELRLGPLRRLGRCLQGSFSTLPRTGILRLCAERRSLAQFMSRVTALCSAYGYATDKVAFLLHGTLLKVAMEPDIFANRSSSVQCNSHSESLRSNGI